MAVTIQVTFDAADPARLGEYWAHALGYEPDAPPAGFETWDEALDAWNVPADQRNTSYAIHDPNGQGARIFFQQVAEPKTAKNRMHLDLRAAPGKTGDERMAALEKVADDLIKLGAERVARVEPGDLHFGHIVMRDPEGNEFCLD